MVSMSPAVDREHVFVTSAKSAKPHRENKQRLLQYLRANPGLSIPDLAYTTTARRMHHTAFRTAYLARTVQEAVDKIEADVRRKDVDTPPTTSKSPVVFVFTGQPSHYAGMGYRLFRDYPVFRRVVDRCAQVAADQGFPSFRDIIVDEHADLTHMTTVQTQLATVTVEAALTAFWASLGIELDMVVGHSLGEYAAFHAAGVLSLADMLYLVGRRAQLVLESCVAGEFSMLAVAAPASQLEPLLMGAGDHTTCRVSCCNMPSATVVSGKKRDIERLHDELRTSHQSIRSKVLPLSFGFHSAQMEPVLEGLAAAAKGVAYASPRVPVASTLTGQVIDAGTQGIINEIYLARQAREPVLFADAVHAIQSHFGAGLQSRPFWLEVGATPVCGPFVRGTIGASLVASSLRPGCDDRQAVAEALAAMYQAGVDIDWPALHRPFRSQLRLLTLPSYAWDLTNYWVTQTRHGDWTPLHKPPPAKSEELGFSGYTCLGRVIDMVGPSDQAGTTAQVTFSTSIDQLAMKDLIAAHRVLGVALCPASVFTDMAAAAVRFVLKSHSGHLSRQDDDENSQDTQPVLVLHGMSLHRPVLLQESSPYRSITTKIVQEGDDDESRFSVVFYQQQPSNPSAQQEIGGCSVEVLAQAAPGEIKESWTNMAYFIQRRCDTLVQDPKSHRLNPSVFYALFSARVEYTEAFQGVQQAFVSPDFQEATAHVCLRPGPAGAVFSASPYHHDSVAHIAGFMLNSRPDRPRDVVYMLNSIERSMCLEPLVAGSPYMVYARVVKVDGADCYCNVYGFKDDAMVLETVGLHFREMPMAVAETILGKNLAVKRTSPPVKPRESLAASRSPRSQPKSSGASLGSSKKMTTSSSAYLFSEPAATTNGSPLSSHGKTSAKPEVRDAGDQRLTTADFEAILECIASQTGADLGQLTDDLCLADLGVESIMTFLITRAVETELGIVLPASLLLSYDGGPSPTIGQLREQLVRPDDLPKADTPSTSKEAESNTSATAMLTPSSSPNGKNGDNVESNTDGHPKTAGSTDGAGRYGSFSSGISAGEFEIGRPGGSRREQISRPLMTVTAEPDPGVGLAAVSSPVRPHQEVISTPKNSELRSVVHLLQGRPSDDRTPLFLMADGSGSAAT